MYSIRSGVSIECTVFACTRGRSVERVVRAEPVVQDVPDDRELRVVRVLVHVRSV